MTSLKVNWNLVNEPTVVFIIGYRTRYQYRTDCFCAHPSSGCASSRVPRLCVVARERFQLSCSIKLLYDVVFTVLSRTPHYH